MFPSKTKRWSKRFGFPSISDLEFLDLGCPLLWSMYIIQKISTLETAFQIKAKQRLCFEMTGMLTRIYTLHTHTYNKTSHGAPYV